MTTDQERIHEVIAFPTGLYSVTYSACLQEAPFTKICANESETIVLGTVSTTIVPSTDRLFPYGLSTGDRSFKGVLDGAVPIYLTEPVPFFTNYYNRLYVSFNSYEDCLCYRGVRKGGSKGAAAPLVFFVVVLMACIS